MVHTNPMLEGGTNLNRIYCVPLVLEINIPKCEGK